MCSWKEFISDKKNKLDVQEFSLKFMDNIMKLHNELKNGAYCHGPYQSFKINDPKPRDIHKSCVKDRLVHHAVYRQLYWFFDRKFIYDSYSCRKDKGTHKAVKQFITYADSVSCNDTKTCWILKCDIKKFFANIDHDILKGILRKHICDAKVLTLLENIIDSFYTNGKPGKGLPLGNLTSQLLVNIYMNEFDQFIKYSLKQKHYIRYADDFVFFSQNKTELEKLIPTISNFLEKKLKLEIHPDKLFIKTLASGIDFLGWVHFSNHRVLRTATKRRMMNKVMMTNKESVFQSYIGLLSHGDGYNHQKRLLIKLRKLQKINKPFLRIPLVFLYLR